MAGVSPIRAFALAARADGWYLRQCNIWAKPNCMPESVKDRTTNSHEYVFHLTKNNDYWYDAEAIKEPDSGQDHARNEAKEIERGGPAGTPPHRGLRTLEGRNGLGRNKRSVWTVCPAQYREGHYAVMPDEIAETCIKAGCPAGGTVLDPFGGAGTTGLVADRLQRDAILIELNPEYAEMARKRITGDAPLFADVA